MEQYLQLNTLTFIIYLSIIVGCDNRQNPSSDSGQILIEGGCGCEIAGLNLDFSDTTSYEFAVLFFNEFDSITVKNLWFGYTIIVYADSGDFAYWESFFSDDTSLRQVSGFYPPNSDSLRIIIAYFGNTPYDVEIIRINQIPNLTFLEFELYSKTAFVDVPEGTESYWREVNTIYRI